MNQFLMERHSKKPLSILSLSLILPLFLLAGCAKDATIPVVPTRQSVTVNTSEVTLDPAQEQDIKLQTARVSEVPFVETIMTTGQIEAANYLQSHVFSTALGRALSVPVQLGQSVHQGQILAVLKSDQVGQMESDLLQLDLQNVSAITQAKIQARFDKIVFDRELGLYQKQVSAKADLDTAQSQYEKDIASLKVLETQRIATIETAQNRLSLYGVGNGTALRVIQNRQIYPNLTIVAPRSGAVINRGVNVGEMVDPSKEIFTLADLHRIWLSGNVYEKDLEKVHIGQPIQVTVDSNPGKSFDGTINFMSEMLDPATRTIEVRGEVANPELLLRPNMFARMNIVPGSRMVLAVPSTAVQKSGDTTFAFVQLAPHRYEERAVSTGQDNGHYIQINKGLTPGEIVVTQGTLALHGQVLKRSEE